MASKQTVVIVTDTTACIPDKFIKDLGIIVVPIELVIDGKVYHDGVDITPKEFYKRLKTTRSIPTTSGSLPGPYIEAFKKARECDGSIVCITEPPHYSGMNNSAKLATEKTLALYPDLSIEVIGSSTVAAGLGLVAIAAARAAREGKSLAEVIAIVEDVMSRVRLYAMLDTLYYLIKGGRVPKVAGLANSVLHIKPVFTIDDGEAHTIALPRTTESAMKHILLWLDKKVVKNKPLHVALMHADASQKAAELREKIKKHCQPQEMFTTEFTPVMGAHTGPGVFGVAFYSEKE